MVKRRFAYWLVIYIALEDYLGRLSKYLFKALAKRFKINKISFKETFGEEKEVRIDPVLQGNFPLLKWPLTFTGR